jgi:hypothetical protein
MILVVSIWLFSAYIQICLRAANPESKFLEAINFGDISQLSAVGMVVNQNVSNRECRRMNFCPAILRAAELGCLQSLAYLSGHRCCLFSRTEIWMDVLKIVRRKRLSHIIKWLYKSELVNMNVQHELLLAVAKQNLVLVKFFLTFPANNLEIARIAIDDDTNPMIVDWIGSAGWTLEMIKSGLLGHVSKDALNNDLLQLIFEAPSGNFPYATLKELAKLLLHKYENYPVEFLKHAYRCEVNSNHPSIADFILKLNQSYTTCIRPSAAARSFLGTCAVQDFLDALTEK